MQARIEAENGTLGNQPTIGIALMKRCVCAKLKTLLTVFRGLVFGHRT
jgi:hypothetical protein